MDRNAIRQGSRLLGQVAALAVIAGATAGCSSDVTRFGDFFSETDNQSTIVASHRMAPDPVVTGSISPSPSYRPPVVTSTALPPAPGAVVNNGPYVRPVSAPATTPSASANYTPVNGTAITVREGETIAVIARRYGVSETSLVKANNLPPNVRLTGGQTLIIPAYNAASSGTSLPPPPMSASTASPAASQAALVKPQPAPASANGNILGRLPPSRPDQVAAIGNAPSGGDVYVVKAGDSLGRIASDRGLRSSDIAAANGFTPDQPIRIGQKLKIPASAASSTRTAMATPDTLSDAMPMPAAPAAKPVAASAAAAAAPQAPTAPVRTASVAPAPKASDATVDDGLGGSFRWPVRGRVVSNFGVKPGGDRNDGINIEVPEGTPIKAAESGEVIYAGDELKGFGNLVLIRHPNGFVSAYAHASEILVRRGDKITRGQTIAKVGSTGNVPRPQLHFEIRNGNRPVDPIPYLSG